jgi:drug/metabolite transporter (DMT)-like permease
VSAITFGAAHFLGGLASKRISPLRVTAVAALTGFTGFFPGLMFLSGTWSTGAMLWGCLSAVSSSLAIVLLYACLAIGPMSILSPIAAVISAIFPMVWGLLVEGERLGPWGYLGIGFALVAVVLVGLVPEGHPARPTVKGLVMAVGSGVMIGFFMILMDLTPKDSGLIPLLFNRGVLAIIMFTTIAIIAIVTPRASEHILEPVAIGATVGSGTRPTPDNAPTEPVAHRGWRPGLLLAIGSGLVDVVANTLLISGLHLGDLSVMSVLVAMYPAGTIILAAVILRERIAYVQWGGLILALIAAALFTFPQ